MAPQENPRDYLRADYIMPGGLKTGLRQVSDEHRDKPEPGTHPGKIE
jgi:hypothetical protein